MDVKVSATLDASGRLDWEIDGKKPKDSSMDFKEDEGPKQVVFKLDDQTKRDLRFDLRNPFSDEKNGAACPKDGAGSDQTEVLACDDKTLTVLNKNTQECSVKYKLRFLDGQGRPVDPVDPEWKNGVKS